MSLRYYQTETLAAILQNYKEGTRQQLVALATGTGKTVIAAQLPSVMREVLPGKMLFIAHRNELLEQAVNKIKTWNPTLKVGLEKAEHHADVDCDVIVASNATIGRAGSTRMDRFNWDTITSIVIDECHHSAAASYINILEDSGVLLPDSNKLLVGLTATPKRRNVLRKQGDKAQLLDDEDVISLKSIFKKITYNYPIRKAIKDGFLVPLRGYRIKTETSLNEVKSVAGDFKANELSEAVNTPDRNAQIVRAWKDNTEGRPTVCFTVDVQHAKDLSEAFLRNGVMAQPVWGDDPQRADKIKWLESGQVTVLCNCALLTEGFDCPKVSCVILARPTRSGTLMTQQVGRGTRLCEGKSDLAVLDVVDNSKRCSLVTFPSLLGLNPEFDLAGQDAVKVAEQIEELQEKNPGVDFTNLVDISNVKAYIESIDLFAEVSDEEVKQHSKFSWMPGQDGSYTLSIPEAKDVSDRKAYYAFKHEKLHLKLNELDEWELTITTTQTERKLGTFNTLAEAFTTADDVIVHCRPDRLKLMGQKEAWHENPASDQQKKYLARLGKKKVIGKCMCAGYRKPNTVCPVCQKITGLTAGEASRAIDRLKHQSKEKV